MSISNEGKNIALSEGTTGAKEIGTTPMIDFETFQIKSHFWGRLTIWAVIVLTLAVPLYLSFVLGFHPGWSTIISGFAAYASIVMFVWVLEPISYYPVLGVSGTYLAFLTGNIGNMCLPCASIAQNVVGAEPGTKKGEITASLAIATASIVNIVMLLIAILAGSYFISLMPESVVSNFRFVLPAIFGAVIAQFAIKKPLFGVIGIAFGLFVNIGPVPRSLQTFLSILGTVVVCMLLEKMKNKKKEA
ncbi:small-conductance mechanosensitive channel [Aquibacillus sp. 3ASR75-11]|uniref:Small-conductance mechanosensitive channel n=1 Tax=Terrihalobacillus insolitus TaxID=2950438 RepID=A0A9X3WSK8_9BACI|nr:small-conductance mechanosensitive channel [Terrihalobacillus insolitus]MDC3413989.1 small-conductance mechanosensitive channel [Terrihalobacillus insolitus]MDC3424078.1 small-conductance mechanosensitive channel [Terrihalobacillus insolitus]